jgi:hypothetical protein
MANRSIGSNGSITVGASVPTSARTICGKTISHPVTSSPSSRYVLYTFFLAAKSKHNLPAIIAISSSSELE